MYSDKTLTCRDCRQTFVFTSGEQDTFASLGFHNEPGRCPECLATRRSKAESNPSMAYGGGASYERRERQLFPAVCADCGKETQVPFQPRADRPVYCSSCFEQHRPRTDSRARPDSRGGARW